MAVFISTQTGNAAAYGRGCLGDGMKVLIPEQLICFVCSVAFGTGVTVLYRLRTWITRGRSHMLIDALLDLGYWLIVIPAFVALILTVCRGELRLYHLCGIGGGVLLTAVFHRTEAKDED